jgi:hypothetical protein
LAFGDQMFEPGYKRVCVLERTFVTRDGMDLGPADLRCGPSNQP